MSTKTGPITTFSICSSTTCDEAGRSVLGGGVDGLGSGSETWCIIRGADFFTSGNAGFPLDSSASVKKSEISSKC